MCFEASVGTIFVPLLYLILIICFLHVTSIEVNATMVLLTNRSWKFGI